MITLDYIKAFKMSLKHCSFVGEQLDNHGYFRHSIGDSLVFYPKNPHDKYHSIGLTPGLNQEEAQLTKDMYHNRILLVAEASNSSGDYIILEDDTRYMKLTGDLRTDMLMYCRQVVKAIINVTGTAESLGITPHDYITKLDD